MGRTGPHILNELLVLHTQRGDAEAFERLAERWQARLLRHAGHLTGDPDAARDVAQEAWLVIARSIRRLKDPARFGPWAYRIVSNKSRDWIRRRRVRRAVAGDMPTQVAAPRTERHAVTDTLNTLPGNQKAILSMFYVDGFSVREISAVLDLKEGTVKSRLFHARNALREALAAEQERKEVSK